MDLLLINATIDNLEWLLTVISASAKLRRFNIIQRSRQTYELSGHDANVIGKSILWILYKRFTVLCIWTYSSSHETRPLIFCAERPRGRCAFAAWSVVRLLLLLLLLAPSRPNYNNSSTSHTVGVLSIELYLPISQSINQSINQRKVRLHDIRQQDSRDACSKA